MVVWFAVLFIHGTLAVNIAVVAERSPFSECPRVDVCRISLTTTSVNAVPVRAVSIMTVTSPNSFFNFFSGTFAPLTSLIVAQPQSRCDSFVSFGLTQRDDGVTDCTAVAPDFTFSDTDFHGSFFCSDPSSSQSTVSSSKPLFISQVSLQSKAGVQSSVSLSLMVYLKNGEAVLLSTACTGAVLTTVSSTTASVATSASTSSSSSSLSASSSTSSSGFSSSTSFASSTSTAVAAGGEESKGWIAGVVVGVLALVGLILLVAVLVRRRKMSSAPTFYGNDDSISHMPPPLPKESFKPSSSPAPVAPAPAAAAAGAGAGAGARNVQLSSGESFPQHDEEPFSDLYDFL